MTAIGPNDSPLYRDWSDPRDREWVELQAREYYDLFKMMRAESMRGHVEYGKWLVATMVAVHGGALFALNGLRNGPGLDAADAAALVQGAAWNVAGILLILFAGFMAWVNFQLAAHTYDRFADPKMLQSLDHWPSKKPVKKTDPINATLFLAAACGVLSWVCFIFSAVTVLGQLAA